MTSRTIFSTALLEAVGGGMECLDTVICRHGRLHDA
jgi:hypothetical protein